MSLKEDQRVVFTAKQEVPAELSVELAAELEGQTCHIASINDDVEADDEVTYTVIFEDDMELEVSGVNLIEESSHDCNED